MAKLHTPEYGILLGKVGHREGPLYMKGKFQYQYQDQYFEIPDFNINSNMINKSCKPDIALVNISNW